MPNPPDRELAVFSAARQLPAAERGAFLDDACAGDPALRQRVEELLQAGEAAGDFLENPAAAPPGPDRTARLELNPIAKAGDRIGRYKLLQQIGEGGCGMVYMAEQTAPVRRRVALKVIKLGMDTKNVIARFEAERQALALMDHPNIAKVLDAGATDTGRPYFVMELVRGIKITDYCDGNNLSTKERLDLFIKVCLAIQHAHQKGVIHRDIKPSNILVTMNDGVPLPKVIDFGIAKATNGKLTDQTLFTAFEQFIGTPAYMSPEQAELSAQDIDTRSDIYSLGVLLYELLTDQTPFGAQQLLQAGLDEIRRVIREDEPARPSTRLRTMLEGDLMTTARLRRTDPPKLIHLVRGDLDWIVMKALEKDRTRRYETANGLAMDLQRHLNNEPVAARPPSELYRIQKLIRRNKLAFVAATVVMVALILALGVALVAVARIRSDNRQIQRAKDDATEELRVSHLAAARALRMSSQGGRRFDSLDAVRKAAAIRPDLAVRDEAIAGLAVSDLRVSKEVILKGHAVNDLVCFDLKLEKYAVEGDDENVTIRAVANDTVLAVLPPASGFKVYWIRCFSPDSRYLRVLYKGEREKYGDWVWDVNERKAVIKDFSSSKPTDTPADWVGNLAANFSSDSRFFSRCHVDGTLSIYELGSGKEVQRFPGTRRFNNLVLSPGNDRVACVSGTNPVVEIRAVASGAKTTRVTCPADVGCVAWSPDGKRLATACRDLRIYIWNVETGLRQAGLEGPTAGITSVAFDHAGNLLASASWDGLIRLWNPDGGREIARHRGGSWQLQFSADDRQLLGWQYAAHFGVLEVADSREFRLLYLPRAKINGSGVSCPSFSVDGRILAATAGDAVRFWDAHSGQPIASLPVSCDTDIFQPDGQGLIVADWTKGVRGRALERIGDSVSFAYRLGKPHSLYDEPGLAQGALSRDGRYLALANLKGESLVLDLKNPSAKPVMLRPDPPVADRIAISPDGHWVATSSWNNSLVHIWDARSGELVRTLHLPGRTLVTFSPDGRWLATSTSEYQLWEVGSWRPKGPPKPGCDVPEWNFTAFSPDGQVMARTMEGTKVQLLETLTEKPLATLEAPDSIGLSEFQFSPGGSYLAVMRQDQQVQLWDLRLIRQELAQMQLDWDLPPYPPADPTAGTLPVTLEVETDVASPAPANE